jgi:hypothetical protein
VTLGFTLTRSNLHEFPLLIRKAASAGIDTIGCRHLEVYHDDMRRESLFGHKTAFNQTRTESLVLAKRLGIQLLIGNHARRRKLRLSTVTNSASAEMIL